MLFLLFFQCLYSYIVECGLEKFTEGFMTVEPSVLWHIHDWRVLPKVTRYTLVLMFLCSQDMGVLFISLLR